ncbi:MAG: ribonuclease R [Legionellaceae bacterium]|nr:ribonuclease R [Legionellaceae bacterium]
MSKKNQTDPFFEREQERYEKPIPSREWITQCLQTHGKPVSRNQLLALLTIEDEEQQLAVGYRLKAMLRDGQLMQDRRGRYCLFDRIILKRGTIKAHQDGFGFFIPEDGSDDMVLSPRDMRYVMDGDIVLCYQTNVDRRGRAEGKVHEVIEHVNHNILGTLYIEHGINYVIPNNKRITQTILIPVEHINHAKHNQIVLLEILTYPSKHSQAVGKILYILGDTLTPGIEVDVAVHTHGIPREWPEEVLADVEKIPQHISEDSIQNRTDLRHLSFVTIDGEDAKDFDDAVYCEPKKDGYQLWVAIADVSHYVTPESPLDIEAANRGNSVYFPDFVVPMLPEALSNGICSLNPKVDRFCMVAEMHITAEGNLSHSQFYRAVIHSHARLTYTQVSQWLQDGKTDPTHTNIWSILLSLQSVYTALLKARHLRGALDFETRETRIEFDENRKIARILPIVRNEAHKIIEECMLAANVSVARHLEKSKLPILYRVHAPPEKEKLDKLRAYLEEQGLQLGGGNTPSTKDFQNSLLSIGTRPDKHRIETIILRSLKQAEYIVENNGHFGLAYKSYTHFTSPIRRYPDLLTHRALGYLLDHKEPSEFFYTPTKIVHFGAHCSMTERRADDASREVTHWLKCQYMLDKLGQTFTGTVTGVTGFGLFVELEDIYVEGLIHVTSLKNDYYLFDAGKHRLIGTKGGAVYQLGDKMQVLVARVDVDDRKIDFELADSDE